ncbi:MAG: PhoX family phosphatase [Alphaproteobacteria bacterium]|nr:PhoX family phosphatase [Alphaproteobacteria bacterium]
MDGTDRLPDGFRRIDAGEDIGINPSGNPTIGDVIAARFGRRDLMRGLLGATAIAATAGPLALAAGRQAHAETMPNFGFKEVRHGVDETHHVAEGHDADILIRRGDPVVAGAPAFDPMNQTAAKQARQFGYNNDFVGFVPLPVGSNGSDHGLLCVNHEYTNPEVMFPGLMRPGAKKLDLEWMTRELVDIELAAHGASVIEIRRGADGKWSVVKDSKYNRRFTTLDTPFEMTGPVAGHDRLKTTADPTGAKVTGTLNCCAGGITPWGTYLIGEENINMYFWGALPAGHAEDANHKRMGVPGKVYAWGKFHGRFDVAKEPNEANRFGWIVEIDPTDPTSTPKKRTALGRCKHEGANVAITRDNTVVTYTGDDERFEYIYRFVSADKYQPGNRAANMDLLDSGTLYVARFDADGKGAWLPLVHGQGKLVAENGFKSQADVLIELRRAGDLAGATKMDRCEDIEPNPRTGKVYACLTNNERRKPDQVDAVNPRAANDFGHIIELTPAGGDHDAAGFTWEILVKCGDPRVADVGAMYNPNTSADGWFGCPDNVAIDSKGRLWVATDQGEAWARKTKTADGVWAVETEGPARGTSRMFFRVPVGAEMCGPWLTEDARTFFVAVQHPGVDGVQEWEKFGRVPSFEDQATRWPDFKPGMPVRPSVVVITKKDGGVIGS